MDAFSPDEQGRGEAYACAWGQDKGFVAVGSGHLWTSPNGYDWTHQGARQELKYRIEDIAYGNGVFVAVGSDLARATSADGLKWSVQDKKDGSKFESVLFAQGLFVAAGYGGQVWTSPDGQAWTHALKGEVDGVKVGNIKGVGYLPARRLYVLSPYYQTLTSPDAVTWTLWDKVGNFPGDLTCHQDFCLGLVWQNRRVRFDPDAPASWSKVREDDTSKKMPLSFVIFGRTRYPLPKD